MIRQSGLSQSTRPSREPLSILLNENGEKKSFLLRVVVVIKNPFLEGMPNQKKKRKKETGIG